MPFRISVVEDPGYVLAEQYGEVTNAEIDEARPKIIEAAVASGKLRVLVDVRETVNLLSTMGYFDAVKGHAEAGFPRPRAALVCRSDQLEDMKFIETLSVNRGLPIRAFVSFREAVRWLME